MSNSSKKDGKSDIKGELIKDEKSGIKSEDINENAGEETVAKMVEKGKSMVASTGERLASSFRFPEFVSRLQEESATSYKSTRS